MPRELETSSADWSGGPFQVTKIGDITRSASLGDDPEEFVLIEGVPVLDEHEMWIEPTEEQKKENPEVQPELLKVDAAVLQYIANKNNRAFEETGDAAALSLGHTKNGLSEVEQQEHAPIVGWAKNFVVAPFLNTDKQAIHADFYLRNQTAVMKDGREQVYTAKYIIDNFPRRSVEILPGHWTIDPIALLGPTTPARWLGVLRYSLNEQGLKYSREPGARSMNPEQMMAAMFNSPAFHEALAKAIAAAMPMPHEQDGDGEHEPDNLDGMLDQGEEVPGNNDGPSENGDAGDGQDSISNMTDEEETPPAAPAKKVKESMAIGDCGEDEEEEEDEDEDDGMTKKVKNSASMPCATNVHIPGNVQMKNKEKPGKKAYALDKEALAKTDKEVADLRARQKIEALEGQLIQLQRDKRKAERIAALREVQAAGYVFEVAEEIDDVVDLDEDKFVKHVERIKKRYQQAPVNVKAVDGAVDGQAIRIGARSSGQNDLGAHDLAQMGRNAGAIMAEKKCNFAEAMAILQTGK